MYKVVITGTESSGKTSLAEALAKHFGTRWVPEAVRQYFAERAPSFPVNGYVEEELLAIAKRQLEVEREVVSKGEEEGRSVVFCDTDLITIRIWGEEKFGRSDPWIVEQTEIRPYDLWLLCAPDIPWEPDPLRENPHDRDRLFEVYERTLQQLGKPYVVVSGPHEARMGTAIAEVERLLNRSSEQRTAVDHW